MAERAAGSEARYPIGTVAERTGLSRHVLRAWERRYGAVSPLRTAGGDRLYSADDVERFRMLRVLTDAGHPIGQVARLATEEIEALAAREVAALESGATRPARKRPQERTAGEWVESAVELVDAMDAAGLHATLTRAVVSLPLSTFIGEVVAPLLRLIGEMWEDELICPAHEHVCSAQVGRVLGALAESLQPRPGAPEAIAATPSGQRHEFGALLAAVVAADEGWRVTYLGPDLPAGDIATAVEARGASVVLLSTVLDAGDPGPVAAVREVREQIGDGPALLVGGRGSAAHRSRLDRAGARWLPDLDALRDALRRLSPEEALA